MYLIKELNRISTYRPSSGDMLRLLTMVEEVEDLCRKEAWEHFRKEGKSETRFRGIIKQLKDNLIDGVFKNSFRDYTLIQKAHFATWKKLATIKTLFGTDNQKSGVYLGKRCLTTALNHGMIEVAMIITKELYHHHCSLEPNLTAVREYRALLIDLQERWNEEIQSDLLYNDMVFAVRKKEPLGEDIKERLDELDVIATHNKDYRFNLARFTAKSIYYRLIGDQAKHIQLCNSAIAFFSAFDTPLPYTTSFTFYFQLIPVFIKNGKHPKAEHYIRKCLELPEVGTQNWHLTLFYMAIVGFHSKKPAISFEAWKLANSTTKKFDSIVISNRWQIIRAYLVWYKKIGLLEIGESFRLGTFLNSVEFAEKDKDGQNVAIIICELLHHLVDDNKSKYMYRADQINTYIYKHLGKKENIRARSMLRIMEKIETADYQREKWLKLSKGYLTALASTEGGLLRDLEVEVIPYEFIINYLKDRLD